jgi:hypothetical protein
MAALYDHWTVCVVRLVSEQAPVDALSENFHFFFCPHVEDGGTTDFKYSR